MSWFKSISDSGEDVFDENADDLNLQSREWISNMKKRVKDGYVDGVDAGEEASLQLGFNIGFKEGAAQTVPVGRLKGIVSAIWCWWQIHHPETPVPSSVMDLLQQVVQHEDAIMEGIRKSLENPPPSVSDVSESMESLEVDQAEPICCGEGCNNTGCCKRGEQMDLDVPHQPQRLSSGSADCSLNSGESLNVLLQRCLDLVSEFGLPPELIHHIQDLKTI